MNQIFKKPTLALAAASLLLTAAMLPLQAQAHRTWLLPSATQLEGKEPWVTVDAAVSENLFDYDTNTLKLDGLHISGPGGATLQPENPHSGRLRSSFDLKLAQPGTYRISLVTESVIASYKQNGEMKRWRGALDAFPREIPANAEALRSTRLHSRLETFVSAGKPGDATVKPSGVGLEMQPLTHPNDLAPGEAARFRLLLDGKPAAGLAVSVVPGGVRYRGVLNEILVKTDANGEFSVTWPRPGMYWVGASYPPRTVAGGNPQGTPPALPERRVSYAATLEVLPQ